jgi:hypothetical protein
MLAGESIVALAKMKDEDFRPEIERILLNTENPRLKIMGAEALGFFRNVESLFVLIEILRKSEPHLYLRDEAVLAMALILGTHRKFYSLLLKYVADNSLALPLAMDEVDSSLEYCRKNLSGKKKEVYNEYAEINYHIDSFHHVVKEYMENKKGEELSRWIMEIPEEHCKGGIVTKMFLAEAILNEEFTDYNCMKLMIVHWAAQELRIWAAMLK